MSLNMGEKPENTLRSYISRIRREERLKSRVCPFCKREVGHVIPREYVCSWRCKAEIKARQKEPTIRWLEERFDSYYALYRLTALDVYLNELDWLAHRLKQWHEKGGYKQYYTIERDERGIPYLAKVKRSAKGGVVEYDRNRPLAGLQPEKG